MMDSINIQWTHCPHIRREILIFISFVLPCLLLLLLLMRVPFTGSAFGWATAMGVVLVIVVIVAAGNISVDMSMLRINLIVTGHTIHYHSLGGFEEFFIIKCFCCIWAC